MRGGPEARRSPSVGNRLPGTLRLLTYNVHSCIGRDGRLSPERIAEFFRNYCRTDMKLDENILSRDEYDKAVAGKKHFRDFATA